MRARLGRASRLRFAFEQAIHRLPDGHLMLSALVVGTGLIGGMPGLPPELQAALDLD